MDRARARARRALGRRRGHERRRDPDAGGGLSDARAMGFDAGVVISASHNPFEDNGIKVFSGRGEKFTERSSARSKRSSPTRAGRSPGRRRCRVDRTDVDRRLPRASRAGVPRSAARSARSSIAIDCANGATTTVAPQLFSELGFDVVVIGDDAGRPQHQPGLRLDASRAAGARRVVEGGCRLGVAFDGDGDRAIFVDHRGPSRRRRRRAADVRAGSCKARAAG